MFNNNNRGRDAGFTSAPAAAAANAKRGQFSVLGGDIVITGNISATADLHIDGRVDGDVRCGALVLGGDGAISGNLHAESARIAGTVDGTVSVRQLTVERAARIRGDVEYENIAIENGARIDGRLKHLGGEVVASAPAQLTGPTVTAE